MLTIVPGVRLTGVSGPDERTLVLYVIDEATDEVAETVKESVRLARELHLWQGPEPSFIDGTPEGSPRTVGAGLRIEGALPDQDKPGVIRLVEHVAVAAETLKVCFEVQLDGSPLGLVAPEGLQPWVADTLRTELGLGTTPESPEPGLGTTPE